MRAQRADDAMDFAFFESFGAAPEYLWITLKSKILLSHSMPRHDIEFLLLMTRMLRLFSLHAPRRISL